MHNAIKIEKNFEIPHFDWKDDNNRPKANGQITHLGLLEKYQIPYIFDIHAHFFPDHVFRAIWQWFDKVDWGIAYRKTESDRLRHLKENRFEYFTTLMYAHKPDMAEGLNNWVYENHSNTPGAILCGTFYPEAGVEKYVKKAIEQLGFHGFKLHCEVARLDLNVAELNDTFKYLEKKGVPIIIHSGTAPLPGHFTGYKYFEPFMKKFPHLKVVVAHMGAHEIISYAALLDQYPGLGLDTTMVFVDFQVAGEDTDKYLYLLDKFADQIYFGSDFPNIPYNLSHPVGKLLNSELKDQTKRSIMYQNACRLFGVL